MKSYKLSQLASGLLVMAGLLATASTGLAQRAPYVYIYSPTNGAKYAAPASLTIYARALGNTSAVQTVEFYAGSTSLGVVTNISSTPPTNGTSAPLYTLAWPNVPAGSYALKAVATDITGLMATSSVVTITVTNVPVPHPSVYIYSPVSGAKYAAPANLTIYARAVEQNGTVQTVQFFAGDTSLGVVPSSSQVVVSNVSTASLFPLPWSNVLAGTYALKAVATDANGLTATSSVVTITVTNPPVYRPSVYIYSPTNGARFAAPASLTICARAYEQNGTVQTVEFFAGDTSLGMVSSQVVVSNLGTEPFFVMPWSNVPVGNYALTAVATDSAGAVATSTPVNIAVVAPPTPTNHPPSVRITSPPNAAVFRTPVNIPIYAYAYAPTGFVASVEFFASSNSLGFGSHVVSTETNRNSTSYANYFVLVWSNAPLGSYALTAKATDNAGASTVSSVVTISVLPPTLPPTNHYVPVVYLSATDPIAIEGTNCWTYAGLSNSLSGWTNWAVGTRVPLTNCGPKNATFTVYRSGDTNAPLTVNYLIGGTATNGIDYLPLPGVITIPAGQRLAMISVVPLDDGPPDVNSTVILTLAPSTNNPAAYTLSSQASAAVLILDGPTPTSASGMTADKTFHVKAVGPDGAWFRVEYSTDTTNWIPICTNQVVNGSIDFIDPTASTAQIRFYRAVPVPDPAQ